VALPAQAAAPWRLAVHAAMLPGLAPAAAAALVTTSGFQGLYWQVGASADPRPDFAGVAVTCLAFEPDDSNPVPPERAAEMAAAIGAANLRICGASMAGQSYAQAYEATLRTCEAYRAAAQKRGLRVLLHQRWATLTASASQLYRVLEQFDPDQVGCVYDAGSMTIEGHEEYRIGLEMLGRYVADVHIASTRHFPAQRGTVWDWEWSPLGDGLMDLQRLLRALRRAGYGGWLTLADRCPGPPAAALLQADRRILQQAMDDLEGIGSHNPFRPLDDHVDLAERPRRVPHLPSSVGHSA